MLIKLDSDRQPRVEAKIVLWLILIMACCGCQIQSAAKQEHSAETTVLTDMPKSQYKVAKYPLNDEVQLTWLSEDEIMFEANADKPDYIKAFMIWNIKTDTYRLAPTMGRVLCSNYTIVLTDKERGPLSSLRPYKQKWGLPIDPKTCDYIFNPDALHSFEQPKIGKVYALDSQTELPVVNVAKIRTNANEAIVTLNEKTLKKQFSYRSHVYIPWMDSYFFGSFYFDLRYDKARPFFWKRNGEISSFYLDKNLATTYVRSGNRSYYPVRSGMLLNLSQAKNQSTISLMLQTESSTKTLLTGKFVAAPVISQSGCQAGVGYHPNWLSSNDTKKHLIIINLCNGKLP